MIHSCQQCGATFLIPDDVSSKAKAELAKTVHEWKSIVGIKQWREATGVELVDAKVTTYHLTMHKGVCHHCKAGLEGDDVITCASCGAINLDW